MTSSASSAAAVAARVAAIAKALTATGSTSDAPHTIHSTEQVAYPVDGLPTPAWKVVVVGDKPLGEWKVYVDAASGAVLGVVSLLKEARGRIFDLIRSRLSTTQLWKIPPQISTRPTSRSSWWAWTAPGILMGRSSAR